jgi:hypothetical protein
VATKKSIAGQRKKVEGACIIPPAIPAEALPNLMFKRDRLAERAIREYMESQVRDEKVTHAERLVTEFVMGNKIEGWDVRTDKARWWVITTPTNLYSQELFPSLDYAISFHVGITARIMSRPSAGVQASEKAIMLPAWRRWERAAEALEEADEAEEFQAVGVRCREALIAMVKAVADPAMKQDADLPKRSDVKAWCELIAGHVAHGGSAEHVRKYLKGVARSGWDLVNWLQHASNATQADAALAIDVTQHVLSIFGTAIFRHSRGIPDRCPECGSYHIGLRFASEDDDSESVTGCQGCGWVEPGNRDPTISA